MGTGSKTFDGYSCRGDSSLWHSVNESRKSAYSDWLVYIHPIRRKDAHIAFKSSITNECYFRTFHLFFAFHLFNDDESVKGYHAGLLKITRCSPYTWTSFGAFVIRRCLSLLIEIIAWLLSWFIFFFSSLISRRQYVWVATAAYDMVGRTQALAGSCADLAFASVSPKFLACNLSRFLTLQYILMPTVYPVAVKEAKNDILHAWFLTRVATGATEKEVIKFSVVTARIIWNEGLGRKSLFAKLRRASVTRGSLHHSCNVCAEMIFECYEAGLPIDLIPHGSLLGHVPETCKIDVELSKYLHTIMLLGDPGLGIKVHPWLPSHRLEKKAGYSMAQPVSFRVTRALRRECRQAETTILYCVSAKRSDRFRMFVADTIDEVEQNLVELARDARTNHWALKIVCREQNRISNIVRAELVKKGWSVSDENLLSLVSKAKYVIGSTSTLLEEANELGLKVFSYQLSGKIGLPDLSGIRKCATLESLVLTVNKEISDG